MTEFEITEPGVYDIPEDVYHRDPVPGGSLSQSGAKKLLAEGGPARYRWQLDHPEPSSEAMELGTAAHKLVLGSGPELVEVKEKNWRKDDAKDAAEAARAAGKVPLLTHQLEQVHAMAAAIRKVPLAVALLDRDRGMLAELSAFWVDGRFGVWRRARFDAVRIDRARGIPLAGDYKTCASAAPEAFARAIDSYCYNQQSEWYRDAYEAIFGVRPEFLFIAQEKEPPYLVAVYGVDAESAAIGAAANDRALAVWRDCREAEASGSEHAWPGYSTEITYLALPRWSRAREDFYA